MISEVFQQNVFSPPIISRWKNTKHLGGVAHVSVDTPHTTLVNLVGCSGYRASTTFTQLIFDSTNVLIVCIDTSDYLFDAVRTHNS